MEDKAPRDAGAWGPYPLWNDSHDTGLPTRGQSKADKADKVPTGPGRRELWRELWEFPRLPVEVPACGVVHDGSWYRQVKSSWVSRVDRFAPLRQLGLDVLEA